MTTEFPGIHPSLVAAAAALAGVSADQLIVVRRSPDPETGPDLVVVVRPGPKRIFTEAEVALALAPAGRHTLVHARLGPSRIGEAQAAAGEGAAPLPRAEVAPQHVGTPNAVQPFTALAPISVPISDSASSTASPVEKSHRPEEHRHPGRGADEGTDISTEIPVEPEPEPEPEPEQLERPRRRK